MIHAIRHSPPTNLAPFEGSILGTLFARIRATLARVFQSIGSFFGRICFRRPAPIYSPSPAISPPVPFAPISSAPILAEFDRIFETTPSWHILFKDQGTPFSIGDARRSIEYNLIQFIQAHAQNTFSLSPDLPAKVLTLQESECLLEQRQGRDVYETVVAKRLELYLTDISAGMQNPAVPFYIKHTALIDLASASLHCPPRRHEETHQIWYKFFSGIRTMDETLAFYEQRSKELIITNVYCLAREPVQTLNKIRSEVGVEFGLDCDIVNLKDPYISMGTAERPKKIRGAIQKSWGQVDSEIDHTADELRATLTDAFQKDLETVLRDGLNERMSQDTAFATEMRLFIANEIRTTHGDSVARPAYLEKTPSPETGTSVDQLTKEGLTFLRRQCNRPNPYLNTQ